MFKVGRMLKQIILLFAFANAYAALPIPLEDVNDGLVVKKRIFSDTTWCREDCEYSKNNVRRATPLPVHVFFERNNALGLKSECVVVSQAGKAISIHIKHEDHVSEEDTISVEFSQPGSRILQTSRIHTCAPREGSPGMITFDQWNEDDVSVWRPNITYGDRPRLQGYYTSQEKSTTIMSFPFASDVRGKVCFVKATVSYSNLDCVKVCCGTADMDESSLVNPVTTFWGNFYVSSG